MDIYNNLKLNTPLLIKLGLVLLGFIIMYFFLSTLLVYTLPFIIAVLIARIIDPIVYVFEKKARLPRGLAVIISLSLFGTIMGIIIMLLGSSIFVELTKLYYRIPDYSKIIYRQVEDALAVIEKTYRSLPPETEEFIKNVINTLLNSISNLLGAFVKMLLGIISRIPGLIIFLIVIFISSFFMSRDKDKIISFIYKQIPPALMEKAKILKGDLIFALIGYIKAQLILMIFSFIISAIGLKIIGIDYAVLIALIIGIVDALPILGTGTVFVPWIVISLLVANFRLAAYLSILYGIVIATRASLEPKVLSEQIGLYPLVTLMAMYIGLQALGIAGLILGPITVIIIKTLQKMDIIPRWKQ